jgi:hypothetical protein
MNKKHRKIVLFWGGLTVYLLMLVAVSLLLHTLQEKQGTDLTTFVAEAHLDLDSLRTVLGRKRAADGLSAILVPLGPNDAYLPGFPLLWDEFRQPVETEIATAEDGGFDGLQAAKEPNAFSKTAIAELSLAGQATQVFRQGSYLLVVNSQNRVQIIACDRAQKPQLLGDLPYDRVMHMEMRGQIAYLLLSHPEIQSRILVIADLENPRRPRELSRIKLPDNTLSFYLTDRQLVLYGESPGNKASLVYLYDLLENHQIVLAGSAPCPSLGNGVLRYDDHLLTPDSNAGLHVYDISDPLHPGDVAFIDLPGKIRYMVRHGHMVFALDNLKRVFVVDLHDPAHPLLSKTVEGAEYPAFLLNYGDYTYYFTLQGYLQVFDIPLAEGSVNPSRGEGRLAGELFTAPGAGGFTLLGSAPRVLPEGVDSVIPLADAAGVVDTVMWHGGVVILQANGLVRFIRSSKSSLPALLASLQLPSGQRWLAAGRDFLYVGGTAKVSILAYGKESQTLAVTGELDLAGAASWDGLVVEQTLCIAAGKAGLLCYALDHPDKPRARAPLTLPAYLASRSEVRQLASPGGNRILAAAGRIGLFDGRIDDEGQFQLRGILNLPNPVRAIAVLNQFCLAATEKDIHVVDIKDERSLQNLAEISLSGVARLVVAAPGYWAGLVPDAGWAVFHAPRVLSPDDAKFLARAEKTAKEPSQHLYRLELFNDHEVQAIPGVMSFVSLIENQTVGAAQDGH